MTYETKTVKEKLTEEETLSAIEVMESAVPFFQNLSRNHLAIDKAMKLIYDPKEVDEVVPEKFRERFAKLGTELAGLIEKANLS